jgi:O-antigen/teichoic acid export membrane protein
MIIVMGMQVLTELGFGAALVHRKDKFEAAKDTAFTMAVIRGIILTIAVVFIVSPTASWVYDKGELNILLRVFSIVFFIDGLRNINIIALQKELNFKLITYMTQTSTLLGTFIIITLAWYLRNVWALVIGSVFNSLIYLVLSYIWVPGKPKFRLNKTIARELFHYGKYITGLSIVTFFITEIDNLLIGKIIGMSELGYYAIAFTLANLPATHISKVASQVLFPLYCKMQGNLEILRLGYSQALRLVSGITIPAATGLIVLAPEIIGSVYGQKWLPAANALQLLALFGVIRSIVALIGYLINGIGKPKTNFKIACIRGLVVIAIIYPLTAQWELVGTCLAITIAITIQLILCMIKLREFIGLYIKEQILIIIPWMIYSSMMGGLIILIKNFFVVGILELIFIILIGVGIYFLIAKKRIKETLTGLKLSSK